MICPSKLLSILQIIVALTLFFTFFMTIPWLGASPISKIEKTSEMAQIYPPPTWAKSYSVNHGKPTYYADYHSEEPSKMFTFIALLAGQLAFLIISAIWALRFRNNAAQKMKENLK